jgi:uncharacterized protein
MTQRAKQFQQEPIFEVSERGNRVIVIERESGDWEAGCKASINGIKARLQQGLASKQRVVSNHAPEIALECTLYLSNKCNLRCRYCYNRDVRNVKENGETMSLDMLKKVVPAVLSMNWKAVNFFLYGGEPLLDPNLVTDAISLIHHENTHYRKRVSFSIETNGTLFTPENIAIIVAADVHVGVSMDGPPAIQNRNRPTKEGRSSYDMVVHGLNLLQQMRIPFSITATIVQPCDLESVFDYLLRFQWTPFIRLSPMLPEGNALQITSNQSCNTSQEALASAHLRVVDRMLANNRYSHFKVHCGNIASMVNNLVTDMRPDFCLKSPCGAGYGMIEFHPNGDIVTCDKTYYRSELGVLGKINDIEHPRDLQSLYDTSPLRRMIASRTVDTITLCKDCAFKRFCGGGCSLGSYLKFGTFAREDVLCEYRKRMFEGLLWRLQDNPYNALLLMKPWLFSQGVSL